MFRILTSRFFYCSLTLLALVAVPQAHAERPALVISNSPLPAKILERAYNRPSRTADITAEDLIGKTYYKPTDTMVSRKVKDLGSELAMLQDKVVILSDALIKIQRANEGKAAAYFAAVATINTQLQTGTTPGNPRLLERFNKAESTLETLGGSIANLNDVAIDSSKVASEASFLLDAARAAYGLSGAVEEDHIRVAQLEDETNATIVMIERLLNTVSGDITRANAYMSSERSNLRTLSLAVANGNIYGRSLADRPFSGTHGIQTVAASAQDTVSFQAPRAIAPAVAAPAPLTERPLVKIKFDSQNVAYQQPLYTAVDEALQRFPNAVFSVRGLHPSQGNAAEVAIESTRARRNAQKVMRTLADIGLASNQVDLSYSQSDDVASNEVHIYIQ